MYQLSTNLLTDVTAISHCDILLLPQIIHKQTLIYIFSAADHQVSQITEAA